MRILQGISKWLLRGQLCQSAKEDPSQLRHQQGPTPLLALSRCGPLLPVLEQLDPDISLGFTHQHSTSVWPTRLSIRTSKVSFKSQCFLLNKQLRGWEGQIASLICQTAHKYDFYFRHRSSQYENQILRIQKFFRKCNWRCYNGSKWLVFGIIRKLYSRRL